MPLKKLLDLIDVKSIVTLAMTGAMIALLFTGVCFFIRATGAFKFMPVISTVFVASLMTVVDSATYRFVEKKSALEDVSRRHGECVDKLAFFIRSVLSHRNRDDLVKAAPAKVAALVQAYFGGEVEVYYCAAVKEGEKYREILTKDIDDCDYGIIEGNCRRELRSCLLFGSYFDFSFGSENGRIIFHFEGFDCVRDPFFVDMIESAYSGLETAIEHIDHADAKDGTEILLRLAQKAEEDDGYTAEHLRNVSAMAKLLALGCGLGEEQAEAIADASRFHDIGKMAIPRSITMKEGRLAEEERLIVSEHTEYGYKILSAFDDEGLALAATIARYHHERYDGGGKYELEGEEIPIEARIVGMCDIFDALTTPRRYKRQWSIKETMDYFAKNSKTQFDPAIVTVLEGLEAEITEIKKSE